MNPILLALVLGAMPDAVVSPEPVANRGDVRTGPAITHTFRLENRGSAAVTLRLGESSCGCVRRELSRAALAPGEAAELAVTVNTLTAPPGPNSWDIAVFAEREGFSQRIALTLKATLIREVTVNPPAVAISTTGSARQTITVSDIRPNPLKLTAAQVNAEFITVRTLGTRNQDGATHHELELSVSESAPVGSHDAVLVMTTTDPQCPELRVPIRVTKRPADAVSVIPMSLSLRFAPGQTVLSGLVQLRAGGKPLAIAGIETTHAGVTATGAANGPSATVRIQVNREKVGDAPGQAEVRITLSEPPGAIITVPVEWSRP